MPKMDHDYATFQEEEQFDALGECYDNVVSVILNTVMNF